MRTFNYRTEYEKLLTPEIVGYLTKLHEYKGEQKLLVEEKKDVLSGLQEIARIQSTEASNRIEGIITTDERLKKIVRDKTTPKNRNEREIAGYRDVLITIHENYDYIPIMPGTFLQLHRDLYRYNGASAGGSFRNSDHVIADEHLDETRQVRFESVPACETPEMIDRLCDALNSALKDPEMDPLLLIPMFILDLLCIQPFNDGNGRMSRLLTLLLLYRSGFVIGKYVSIDKIIGFTKETYSEALQGSSIHWNEGVNDYLPFVRYLLGVITASYNEFYTQVDILVKKGFSKPDRVREIIKNTSGKITKAEIMNQCPDISQKTVERALTELLDSGKIRKIGGGRYTSYVWNWEN